MPKAAPYWLNWDPQLGSYTLHDRRSERALFVAPNSHEWIDWLASIPSFTFSGQQGHLTVRQESRSGGIYWYAYRRAGEKMAKKYLGRTGELTLARLEEIAHQFTIASDFHLKQKESLIHPYYDTGVSTLGQQGSKEAPVHDRPQAVNAWHGTRDYGLAHEQASIFSGEDRSALLDAGYDLRLTTKLAIPQVRAQLVRRSRLLKHLEQGMQATLLLQYRPPRPNPYWHFSPPTCSINSQGTFSSSSMTIMSSLLTPFIVR